MLSTDSIIIATTTNKEDDRISELAIKEGLNFYRGSEDDVLDRYYQAAKEYKVKHIMRLTADCPLIASEVLDSIAGTYFKSGVDYISALAKHLPKALIVKLSDSGLLPRLGLKPNYYSPSVSM